MYHVSISADSCQKAEHLLLGMFQVRSHRCRVVCWFTCRNLSCWRYMSKKTRSFCTHASFILIDAYRDGRLFLLNHFLSQSWLSCLSINQVHNLWNFSIYDFLHGIQVSLNLGSITSAAMASVLSRYGCNLFLTDTISAFATLKQLSDLPSMNNLRLCSRPTITGETQENVTMFSSYI